MKLPIRIIAYLFNFQKPDPGQSWLRANLVRSTLWSLIALTISGLFSGGIHFDRGDVALPSGSRDQSNADPESASGDATGNTGVDVKVQLSLMMPPLLPATKYFGDTTELRTRFALGKITFIPYQSTSGELGTDVTNFTTRGQCALVPHGLPLRFTSITPPRYVMNMTGSVRYTRRNSTYLYFSNHAQWLIRLLNIKELEEVRTSWNELVESWQSLTPTTEIVASAKLYRDIPDVRVAGMVCI